MAGTPPKKNTAYTFFTALTSQADTKLLKANPTLAAGDCVVSIAGGAFANLATLPDAYPAAGAAVRVQLSAAEMNGDNIIVKFVDAAGAEWCDQLIAIQTDTATIGEIKTETASILDDTDDIGVAGAGLTAVPWNAAWDAEAQSEAADALNAYDPPTNTEMEARTLVAANYFDPAADTIAAVTTVASTTTIGATGLTAIAAAVWDRLTSALTTVGSVGALVVAKLALITSGVVTVSSPVATSGNVTTYMGDDYLTADGRQLVFPVASAAVLTGGTVAVVINGVGSFAGLVVSETSVTLDLTKVQTATIPAASGYDYSVVHTQSVALGSNITTLREGRWISKRALSAT